jgi:hypothetical protein
LLLIRVETGHQEEKNCEILDDDGLAVMILKLESWMQANMQDPE